MEFDLPTNKTEMYATLKDIYRYYRINKEGYTPTVIPVLTLPKITFTPLTDLEIAAKAQTLVVAEQEKLLSEKTFALNREKHTLTAKLSVLSDQLDETEDKINAEFDATEVKVLADAEKRGLADSTIVNAKLADLEVKRNVTLLEAQTNIMGKTSDVNSQIEAIEFEIQNLPTLFEDRFDAEKDKKILELKEEQEKTAREIQKYNDAQDEKTVKQAISTALANANLQIRYMSLSANAFTKEQLVSMGYYEDAIKCVSAYYDTLTPLSAYQDFISETGLIFFLDDFYQDVLYMYRTLAGL